MHWTDSEGHYPLHESLCTGLDHYHVGTRASWQAKLPSCSGGRWTLGDQGSTHIIDLHCCDPRIQTIDPQHAIVHRVRENADAQLAQVIHTR